MEMLPAAILAGGLATRLRPLSESVPKCLIDVNGEPFVVHQLRLLKSHGIRRVVICAGYLGDRIEQFVREGNSQGLEIEFSFDGSTLLGTAGALKKALPLLGDAFFVLYGDSYLNCDYRAVQAEFQNAGRMGLMTVFHNSGLWDTSNVEYSGSAIIRYDKQKRTAAMEHIDYGLGVLRRDAFDLVPDGRAWDLAKLYQDLLARGELAAFEVHERFYEIGSVEGLEETRMYLADRTGDERRTNR